MSSLSNDQSAKPQAVWVLTPNLSPEGKWKTIIMDLITPLPMTINGNIYLHHGLPDKISYDMEPIFMSRFWKAVFVSLKTNIFPSTAYHPQTEGQTEITD